MVTILTSDTLSFGCKQYFCTEFATMEKSIRNMSIRNQKLLYHLTSLDNLASILADGLLSRDDIAQFDDVAEPEIIGFRTTNNLTKYVPFHFFSKNPFDGKVQRAYSDKEFVYICVQRTFAEKNNFKIIPKHPSSMNPLVLYDYSEGMNVIDWETMDRRDYSNQSCKNICMAECLSPSRINPRDFYCIYVRTKEAEDYVRYQIQNILGSIPFYVNVNENMFVR